MSGGTVTLTSAFLAGLASFLSPCVLPLIPAYLSWMTGLSTSELSETQRPGARVVIPSLLFVLGFTFVFVGMGASASVLGKLLSGSRAIVEVVAGVLVIAFGVLMLGVIKVPWLYGEARADMSKARAFNRWAAVVMGMAFAAGWTPCVGPILGSVLLLAVRSENVGQGALLLAVYSAGLGVPFVAVALFFSQMRPVLTWVKRHSLVLNRTAGVILIVIGVLVATGRLELLTSAVARVFPGIGL
jgi:cytochrome c-type biogenesis protein